MLKVYTNPFNAFKYTFCIVTIDFSIKLLCPYLVIDRKLYDLDLPLY